MKLLLEMKSKEAREFLLESDNYANFEIPEYFNFQRILDKVNKFTQGKDLKSFCATQISSNGKSKIILPSQLENVNYKFVNNKDGKYAYRPFQLIHPVLYVKLVQTVTDKNNWKKITKRFAKLHKHKEIECVGIPGKSTNSKTSTKKATIINWWTKIEQRSIELSLDYDYVIHTDITNCYPNIYTHSVAWAIESRKTAKEVRDRSLLGNQIDSILQSMSYGQTNGIPQGCKLMDFIAEMVLGYADLQLGNTIRSLKGRYKILRYRDDYRIFTNSPVEAKMIMKSLTDILSELGLSLGASKTFVSDDVVRSSLKEDKLYWLSVVNYQYRFQKQLLLINNLSHKHPNSGQLGNELRKFYARIEKFSKKFNDTHALISIVVDIALRNPKMYPLCTAIISILIRKLKRKEQKRIVRKVITKFDRIPNTGHMMIWLQRIFINIDPKQNFNEKLCKVVKDPSKKLWNSRWLNGNLKDIVDNTRIVDQKAVKSIDNIIPLKSVEGGLYSMNIELDQPIILTGDEAKKLLESQNNLKKVMKLFDLIEEE